MSYQIVLTNGSILTNVPDSTLDSSTTSLTLIGRNYTGYGTVLNDNFVHLLENSANITSPAAPLLGQLWFNAATTPGVLKVCTAVGTSSGGITTPPTWTSVLTTGVTSIGSDPAGSQPATVLTGAVTFNSLIAAGLAKTLSPVLITPSASTSPTLSDSSTLLATTQFVKQNIAAISTGVTSVLGSAGVVTLAELTSTGLLAPQTSPTLSNPTFTGTVTAPTVSAGTSNTQVATTQYVAGALSQAALGGTNLLLNPLFNVQEFGGTSYHQVGSGTYTAYIDDAWLAQVNGTPSLDGSLRALTDSDRASIGDESAEYALVASTTGTPAANDYLLVGQRIEDVYKTSNKPVVFSFWAYANPAPALVCIEFTQNFGNGVGASSPVVGIGQQVFTLTSGWAFYSTTAITIPSVAGKTRGNTNNNGANTDYLAVRIYLTAGSTAGATAGNIGTQAFTLTMWNPQLEIGTVATKNVRRTYSQELALCQRYYEKGTYSLAGYANVTPGATATIPFKVTKRGSLYTTITYTIDTVYSAGNVTSAVASTTPYSTTAMQIAITPTANGSYYASGDWSASSML